MFFQSLEHEIKYDKTVSLGQKQNSINVRNDFHEVKCQMAELHHHKQKSHKTGQSIKVAMLHSTGLLLGFLWRNGCEQQIKSPAVPCDDLCHRSLTLERPEPSCGGRDLDAAVTRALDVARFPIEYKSVITTNTGIYLSVSSCTCYTERKRLFSLSFQEVFFFFQAYNCFISVRTGAAA